MAESFPLGLRSLLQHAAFLGTWAQIMFARPRLPGLKAGCKTPWRLSSQQGSWAATAKVLFTVESTRT